MYYHLLQLLLHQPKTRKTSSTEVLEASVYNGHTHTFVLRRWYVVMVKRTWQPCACVCVCTAPCGPRCNGRGACLFFLWLLRVIGGFMTAASQGMGTAPLFTLCSALLPPHLLWGSCLSWCCAEAVHSWVLSTIIWCLPGSYSTLSTRGRGNKHWKCIHPFGPNALRHSHYYNVVVVMTKY